MIRVRQPMLTIHLASGWFIQGSVIAYQRTENNFLAPDGKFQLIVISGILRRRGSALCGIQTAA
jgi:hypothetical protein